MANPVTSLKPSDVQIDAGGMLVGTLGRAENEFTAALIVRWHQARQLIAWAPISRVDLAELFNADEVVKEWARNPFWRPVPGAFSEDGFIDGWSGDRPDAKGTLTEKFFAGLARRFKPAASRATPRRGDDHVTEKPLPYVHGRQCGFDLHNCPDFEVHIAEVVAYRQRSGTEGATDEAVRAMYNKSRADAGLPAIPAKSTPVFNAFLALTPEQRRTITCWFCLICGDHLGPETGGRCPRETCNHDAQERARAQVDLDKALARVDELQGQLNSRLTESDAFRAGFTTALLREKDPESFAAVQALMHGWGSLEDYVQKRILRADFIATRQLEAKMMDVRDALAAALATIELVRAAGARDNIEQWRALLVET